MAERNQVAPAGDLAQALDKLQIFELARMERLWRDLGQWDKLAEAYMY